MTRLPSCRFPKWNSFTLYQPVVCPAHNPEQTLLDEWLLTPSNLYAQQKLVDTTAWSDEIAKLNRLADIVSYTGFSIANSYEYEWWIWNDKSLVMGVEWIEKFLRLRRDKFWQLLCLLHAFYSIFGDCCDQHHTNEILFCAFVFIPSLLWPYETSNESIVRLICSKKNHLVTLLATRVIC